MSFPPVYNPAVANPNDGELITQCKILDQIASSGAKVEDHSSGSNGGQIVAESSESGAGNWYALQFVTSGTLTAYAGNITGTVEGVTFPAGFVLYGNTTGFTTGSGTTIVAYAA